MSSPNSSAPSKPQRPGHGSRHSSSWINRLHRHHDRKRHTPADEQEPLLANDEPDSDIEAQEAPQPQQDSESRARDCMTATKQWLSKVGHESRHKLENAYEATKRTVSRNWKSLLIALALTLLTLLISLAVGFYVHHKTHDKMAVCTTAACVHAASGILYNLDPSFSSAILHNVESAFAKVDACTDFNQLTCGGFDARHDLRPDQSDMFTGTLMVENSQTVLRHILESDGSDLSSGDKSNFEKLKADYNACMDESTIKKLGLGPIKKITDEVKTLYPVSNASSKAWGASPLMSAQHSVNYKSSNELTDTLLYLIEFGIGGFMSVGVGVSRQPTNHLALGKMMTAQHGVLTFLQCSVVAIKY